MREEGNSVSDNHPVCAYFRRCLKAARSIFAEGGIWEIRGIGSGLRPVGTDSADHVTVDLIPGAEKSRASAVCIDAVIRIENLN